LQRGVQVSAQLFVVGVTRGGQRSYDYQATGGQQTQALADQVPKSALDQIARHRVAHGLAHDETRTRRGSTPPRSVRVRIVMATAAVCAQVDDQKGPPGPASAAYRVREVLAPPQPILGGQHSM
jgi:hypothetical protein